MASNRQGGKPESASPTGSIALEDVWRAELPHVLGALLRTHQNLEDCQDAAQEALIAASEQWGKEGTPNNPRAWLITVARRRLIDQFRGNQTREQREIRVALVERWESVDGTGAPIPATDDSLQLILLCCHPVLSRSSQIALSLRCVAGLSTAEIASAYLVPEATMAQRLSRARSQLKQAGASFPLPNNEDLPRRVAAALDVCHLIFNEGYSRSQGKDLTAAELEKEGIRLARLVCAAIPDHDEAAGLLALTLLTDARAASRVNDDGDLVPLQEQSRALWDQKLIAEGVSILERVLPRGHVGRYQLQASIVAVHSEAASYAETDWLQITLLYEMLQRVAPSLAVSLNRAAAVAMVSGPEAGIELVLELLKEPSAQKYHRTHAVLAHLLELAGQPQAAVEHFGLAHGSLKACQNSAI